MKNQPWTQRAGVARAVRRLRSTGLGGLAFLGIWLFAAGARGEDILPKHITPETARAIQRGLDYLASQQRDDGSWQNNDDGETYPVAMASLAGTAFLSNGCTSTRGKYANNLKNVTSFLLACQPPQKAGLITGANDDSGSPMHGHGFALQFLATVYGMETRPNVRRRIHDAVTQAVILTSRGQSSYGGWTYTPGSGDEGSVTVTQVQALRAAKNAGFYVPPETINKALSYLERCKTAEGGICYSLGSGGETRLPISAAAVATLYNAGEFDSPIAESCLEYIWKNLGAQEDFSTDSGHDFYCHLYAAQGFYMAGDKYWDVYFPRIRDQLLALQDQGNGSWEGDGVGHVYGTSIALIVLQLPYKYLPVYQR